MESQQLMQEDSQDHKSKLRYDEEWEVYVSNQKEPYILNEYEHYILEEVLMSEKKSNVFFNTFVLNTAFFVSARLVARRLKPEFSPKLLASQIDHKLTPEEKERINNKINEIRSRMLRKS